MPFGDGALVRGPMTPGTQTESAVRFQEVSPREAAAIAESLGEAGLTKGKKWVPVTVMLAEEGHEREALALARNLADRGAVLEAVTRLREDLASGNLEKPHSDVHPKGRRFVFEKAGEIWKVVFRGSAEFYIHDTLGARYVNHLLHHRDPISAFDLEVLIRPGKRSRKRTPDREGADAKAVTVYLKELEELRALQVKAAEVGNDVEVREMTREIEQIEAALTQGGAADTGERSRNNVRKAVGGLVATLLKLGGPGKAFGLHLQKHMSLGYVIWYRAPSEDWR